MAFELETERLVLNGWQESDAASYRRLVGERGAAMPALDAARSKIISSRAASAANGVATLPIRCRADGDFIGYCGLVTGRATLAEPGDRLRAEPQHLGRAWRDRLERPRALARDL